jgi:hypothetical protein
MSVMAARNWLSKQSGGEVPFKNFFYALKHEKISNNNPFSLE